MKTIIWNAIRENGPGDSSFTGSIRIRNVNVTTIEKAIARATCFPVSRISAFPDGRLIIGRAKQYPLTGSWKEENK